ncbi:alpha/beta fold hydrolase [Bacillus sp. AFS017336]|uniref:alpha/beta fold hydrolase n=1 Tax=Bacillus sp. AFS017336 TaxID=2033489 RepID=UPI000BF05B70|nr:alpha/beta hydrolase [Bacillus sp. AFS017336]PEL06756.1 alpha/beta hydrolase [Bacillus sp. AFS017336]
MLLNTEVLGEGEPIVFLHTGLQTGMTDFDYQRGYFVQKNKVILPDLRGHGKSTSNDLSNFFIDSATDLTDTFEYHEIQSAHIVGCSLGALVALFFSKKFPEKVKTLTISGLMPEKPTDWLEIHKKNVEQQSKTINYFNNLHGEGWKQFIYMGRNEDWYPFEITCDLSGLKMPILFMVGEGNLHEIKGTITYPNADNDIHVAVIPFASHLVHIDQPEIYTNILEKFISQYELHIN